MLAPHAARRWREPGTSTPSLIALLLSLCLSLPQGRKQSKGLKALEVTTGGTRGGLTISTGLEIELSKEVKEVPKGCCTLL